MNELEKIFGGQGDGRVERILALCKRLQEIDSACSLIKYDNELVMEIPEVLKTLGAAKDAAVAELKTV